MRDEIVMPAPPEDFPVVVSPDEIPYRIACSAYYASSFDPERRAQAYIAIQCYLTRAAEGGGGELFMEELLTTAAYETDAVRFAAGERTVRNVD